MSNESNVCTCSRCGRTALADDSGLPDGWQAVLVDEDGERVEGIYICSGCEDSDHLIPQEGEAAFLNVDAGATFRLVIEARPDPERGTGLGTGTFWTIEQFPRKNDGSDVSFGFDSLDLAMAFLDDELRRYEKAD